MLRLYTFNNCISKYTSSFSLLFSFFSHMLSSFTPPRLENEIWRMPLNSITFSDPMVHPFFHLIWLVTSSSRMLQESAVVMNLTQKSPEVYCWQILAIQPYQLNRRRLMEQTMISTQKNKALIRSNDVAIWQNYRTEKDPCISPSWWLTLHEWVKSRRYPVRATPTIPGIAPTVFVIPCTKVSEAAFTLNSIQT